MALLENVAFSQLLVFQLICQLWDPMVHYRVQRSLPLVPVLCNINEDYDLVTDFFTINYKVFSLKRKQPIDSTNPITECTLTKCDIQGVFYGGTARHMADYTVAA